MQQIDLVLADLEKANELADLQQVIERLRDALSVDHMIYHWVNAKGARTGVGTYSIEWVNRYVEKGYVRIAPVILGGIRGFHPVDWKRLDWSSKAAKQFQADAIAHGVGNQGMSIPIRGPHGQFALFTASHNCSDEHWADFIEEGRPDLILLAHFFNKRAPELEPYSLPNSIPQLSPREQEALTLLALGYSRAQIAQTLSISEHTLRVYVESARFKLGALNTTHAVSVAIAQVLIIV
jgi:DNA-binding CsgD family transcriptional regulator